MSKICYVRGSQERLQLHRKISPPVHWYQLLRKRLLPWRAPEANIHHPADPEPWYVCIPLVEEYSVNMDAACSVLWFWLHDCCSAVTLLELVFLPSSFYNPYHFLYACIVFAVKAAATEALHLQAGPDRQLELDWEEPAGNVPGHCLEWEVEHSQEEPDGEIVSVWFICPVQRAPAKVDQDFD